MGDIAEKVLEVRSSVVKKLIVFTAEDVSSTDTITLGDLTTINGAALLDRSDGSAITFTKATNVLTLTSGSDADIIGIAVGTTA